MLTEATVSNLDDERLIRDGEAAVDLYNKDLKNARARIMPMARGLFAARQKYPSDQDFSDWLHTSSYREIEYNERAALIKIGKHDAFATKFVRTTNLISPRTIWEAIEDLMSVSHHVKPTVVTEQIPEQSAIAVVSSENSKSSTPPEATKSVGTQNEDVDRRNRLYGVPRAAEVFAIFLNKNTRTALSTLKPRRDFAQIWQLILTALDAGIMIPTETEIRDANLRILFPTARGRYCARLDLTDKKTREHIRDHLLPLMIEHKEALFAQPDQIEKILEDAQRKRTADHRAATIAQRAVKAMASLPPDESEVIMFGKRMWPIVEGETIGAYDFATLQVAVWKFTDLNRWLHRESPRSRAINIRNSTKWDRHHIGELLKDSGDLRFKVDRIYQLVHAIAQLMDQNPEGECKEPLTPLVLG
jgi:hypothetical protein